MVLLKTVAPLLCSLLLTLPLQQSGKKIIKAGPALGLPFSPAVQAGNLIYVSGAMATDAQGKLAPGNIQAQTRRTLDNIAQVLKAAGVGLAGALHGGSRLHLATVAKARGGGGALGKR